MYDSALPHFQVPFLDANAVLQGLPRHRAPASDSFVSSPESTPQPLVDLLESLLAVRAGEDGAKFWQLVSECKVRLLWPIHFMC